MNSGSHGHFPLFYIVVLFSFSGQVHWNPSYLPFMLLNFGWSQHPKLWKTGSFRLWPPFPMRHRNFSDVTLTMIISGIYLHHWVKLFSILKVSSLDTTIKHVCPQLYSIWKVPKCPSEYLIFHLLLLLLLLLLTLYSFYYHCCLLMRQFSGGFQPCTIFLLW